MRCVSYTAVALQNKRQIISTIGPLLHICPKIMWWDYLCTLLPQSLMRPQHTAGPKATRPPTCLCALVFSQPVGIPLPWSELWGGFLYNLTEWIISSALSMNRPVKCWLCLQCLDMLKGILEDFLFFAAAAGLWSIELDSVAMALCPTSHCNGVPLFSLCRNAPHLLTQAFVACTSGSQSRMALQKKAEVRGHARAFPLGLLFCNQICCGHKKSRSNISGKHCSAGTVQFICSLALSSTWSLLLHKCCM